MNRIKVLLNANREHETSYSVFWPGMSYQVEDKVSQCSICNQFQRAQPKEPMVIQEIPNRPWAKSDLFEFNGAHYLLSVDYYSKWIEIAKPSNLSSNNVICHLESQFAKNMVSQMKYMYM